MIRKILFGVLILLTVVVFLTLIMAPGISRRYIVNHSKELTGRKIDIEKIKINYFTATIRLINFKMYESNETNVFTAFDTLLINTEPLHLFKDKLVVEQFYLKGLKSNIVQNDSVFNFDDLIDFFGGDEDSLQMEDQSEETNFKFEFSNIELKNAEFVYTDVQLDKTLSTNDLSLLIPFISWDQEHSSEAGLKFYFENGGFFQSDIEVDPNTGNFLANIQIDQLFLSPFYEYTLDYANLGSLEGSLNTNLTLSGNTSRPEQLTVKGVFELFDLKTTDERQVLLLDIPHIRGGLKNIDYYNEHYAFDSLTLIDPYFYVELYDSTINVIEASDYYAYFPEEEESSESIESSSGEIGEQQINDTNIQPTSSLFYGFDKMAIINGSMKLVDNTTPDPFTYNLSKIELQTDSFYSNEDWVTLYATMLLNDRGKLVAELGYYPDDPMDLSVNYVITDFLLSDLNIYSRHYMGFPILYGDMYYKAETKILKGQLTSENKLVIHNAELGNKRGGLYNLPLKFALFLLKDRHGVIDLNIPVRGDLNDPRVSIGKIVWNTFKNLIVKVAAAPFDFLAGVIGVSPKDIKSIDYAYLDTALTASRQRQLDLLLELEQKKAELEIELVYFNDIELEKRQIYVDEAGKLFATESGLDYRTNENEFLQFLQTRTEQDSVDIVTASQQIVQTTVVDSVALALQKYRRQSIENYLAKTSDSTEIKVFIPDTKSPKNVAAEPHFEVKYAMKGEASEPE